MNQTSNITADILKFIDDWWGILVPIVLMMIFKTMIADIINWFFFKWSDSPYTGTGNIIMFEENGTEYKIWRHSVKNIYFKEMKNGDETGFILKMNMYEYNKKKLIYKEV
jgi:hypothetical protein